MIKRNNLNKTAPFKKTLFIDDDEISIFITSKIAEKAEFTDEILVFSDPEYAIDYISMSDDQDGMPDAIFLDINMPKINGWEVLEKIRKHINPYKTKIFIYTSSLNIHDKLRARKDFHITDFVLKPLTVDKMKDLKVKYQLEVISLGQS